MMMNFISVMRSVSLELLKEEWGGVNLSSVITLCCLSFVSLLYFFLFLYLFGWEVSRV
jgi:hypothetical protein